MKSLLTALTIFLLTITYSFAQSGREVHGTIIDSTKQTVPSANVKLISDKGDSTISIADINGKFSFQGIKGTKLTVTITSIGYQALRKHFTLDNTNNAADLGNVVLKIQSNMLNTVTIVGSVPVVIKEDTVQYQASAYKVRENAPAEDLIKKLPGVDVDVNGNITTQGKQVTKVRINGKDFMGGDVQSATKNLPADVIENIQMIDDYGDQANLTGVKTGEPDKIMNITIRKDKNYGYFGQATVGDGEDALPQSQGIADKNRYIGSINAFKFNGDQQIAVLGSINNTNVNTFSFGSTAGGGGGFGGGGGRGNAGRGAAGGNSGSLTTTQNGITDAHSIGINFRDQWGKKLSVYGSYSFADNTVNTVNNILQQNTSPTNPTQQQQNTNEKDENINHRFTWNMEYKPDTSNYLKVTPTFSYAGTNTNDFEDNTFLRNNAVSSAYTSLTNGDSQAPTYGVIALYNHKFKHRRNLSINATVSSGKSDSYQNPTYNYTIGVPTAPLNQVINTDSRTTSYGVNLSFLQPLGKFSYLELNYAFNRSNTTNNKETDTLYDAANYTFRSDSALSTRYNYSFTTNKVGLNYRFVQKKYNYTVGVGFQPAVLDGDSPTTGVTTHVSTFNVIPTARFIYNFSRSKSFSVNYNGSSTQPTFAQLQPVVDFSNALYPVEGNPNLKPQFTNNISIRYNNFSFATGDVFFANLSYQSIQNQVVTNTITYPRRYLLDPRFQNTILTQYTNADGYYTTSARVNYIKPWENRKFSLTLNGTVTYTNNIGYLTNIDSTTYTSTTEKNVAKNLALTPEVRFRVDITDKVDAQFITNYVINRTSNSVQNPLVDGISNLRTWNIGVNGKNYFGDWTVSYDYSKANNYGYASSVKVTNPNTLNMYVERRFMKDHRGTFRIAAYDLFNENTGFSSTTTASSVTQTHVNRLARYYLATFTLRLQKFAGKAPTQDPATRGFRRDGGGGGRGDGPGGPGGGGFGGGPTIN
ncbi:outer membrane beta-barrel protein [Mucilaginibacter sp.]|uniref:outer membrane beta-barrel protein n=1 Tax=Mucilaginibacter sp. TaxID=1882438 RepID=UPI003D0E6C03